MGYALNHKDMVAQSLSSKVVTDDKILVNTTKPMKRIHDHTLETGEWHRDCTAAARVEDDMAVRARSISSEHLTETYPTTDLVNSTGTTGFNNTAPHPRARIENDSRVCPSSTPLFADFLQANQSNEFSGNPHAASRDREDQVLPSSCPPGQPKSNFLRKRKPSKVTGISRSSASNENGSDVLAPTSLFKLSSSLGKQSGNADSTSCPSGTKGNVLQILSTSRRAKTDPLHANSASRLNDAPHSTSNKNVIQVFSTTRPKSDSLPAKKSTETIDNVREKRRPSLKITIPKSLFASQPQSPLLQDRNTGVEKSDERPGDQSRRNSLRGSFSTFITRRLSNQLTPTFRRPSNSNESHMAPASSDEYTVYRAPEWPDRTEEDYIRRKNLAEEKRGAVYEEDAFEEETASMVVRPAYTLLTPAPDKYKPPSLVAQSLLRPGTSPLSPTPSESPSRSQTAPQFITQMSKKPLTAPTRANALKALRRSYLRQSPMDWSEFDAPEAEYFLVNTHYESLVSALKQAIAEEELGHKIWEENDHFVEGEWCSSMDEALAEFEGDGF